MSEFVTLGDHIAVQKGKAPRATGYSGPEAEPYLNPEHLRGRASVEFVKAGSDAVRASDGDTILLWDGSNAGEFFRAKAGLVASTMAKISPSKVFNSTYFFHVAKQAEIYLKSQTHGTGIPHVDRALLEAIRAFCPSSTEQRLIAAILDTLDTAIHETEAIIAKLKAVKQGLLYDLLTRGIDANGELRPPQAEAPHLYKESPLGWIPKDWDVSGLAGVTPKDRSVIRTGPFGSSLKGEHWRESGRPVVTIGSLGEAAFVASELLYVDEVTAARLAEFELIPGDVVFSRVADVGRSVVVSESERGWIMSSNFMRISCDSAKARPQFLQLLLSSSVLVRRQLRTTVNSAGRDVANSAVLMGLSFPWPSPCEQDEVLRTVHATNQLLVQEEAELKKLVDGKSGLMDDLITGRVRVTPLLADTEREKECA